MARLLDVLPEGPQEDDTSAGALSAIGHVGIRSVPAKGGAPRNCADRPRHRPESPRRGSPPVLALSSLPTPLPSSTSLAKLLGRTGPAALNDSPFAHVDFVAGLEAAGYLEKLDTSEARITARYQHGLEKADFAAHSEEFCGQQGVRKVHRSVVQFFHEDPTPMDPFVHVIVGTLPPREEAIVEPLDAPSGTSSWVPIQSRNEAPGTMHFTVSIDGFWPIVVVFDSNQADLAREDRYARINPDDDSESDPEAYLDGGRSYSRAPRRMSRRGSVHSSGRAAGYGAGGGAGVLRSSSRASLRRRAAHDDDEYSSSSDEDEELDRAPPRRRTAGGSRRGSVSAGMADLSLARSSSRASGHRRGSIAY